MALAVFGRDEKFDPGADPVVRLEAGRLRRTLATYYVDAGKDDDVRITIPKGAYVPHFEWQERASTAGPYQTPKDDRKLSQARGYNASVDNEPRTGLSEIADIARLRRPGVRKAAAYLAVAVAAVAVASGAWLWFGQKAPDMANERNASVVVLPFQSMGASEITTPIANGVTQELVGNLLRFPDFRLYRATDDEGLNTSRDPVQLGRDLNVTFVVDGSVQVAGQKVRINGRLLDTGTGEIVWSGSFDRALEPGNLLDMEADLASSIATELGEPYGVVSEVMSWRLAKSSSPSMPSYLCVLQAYEYRRAFEDALYQPARACIMRAVVSDPDYADAWAMLGWLHLEAVRQDMVPEAEHSAEMAAALAAAGHALQLDPQNQRGLEALAAIAFSNGDYAESERLQRVAVALNPNNPEALAQLGWRLAVRGKFDEGIPLLDKAISRSVNPPGWYFHLISFHDYLKGDYASALAAAQRSASQGSAVGLSLAAISHAKLGNMEAARDDLAAMAAAWPLLARDPAAAYRKFQAEDQLISAMVGALRDAGWVAPSTLP